ncbi:MAG: efflux RND transporter periplasmic adaptor subunit [Kiritimatiellaceae bacterium]|nr:efflux RND transporter periplasmic adaptor subunit [Kiritimatiellaceae bacterium]
MKNLLLLVGSLLLAVSIAAEEKTCATGDCSCTSCVAKEKGTFSLPALQGLEKDEHAVSDHANEAAEEVVEKLENESHTDCDHDHSAEEHVDEPAPHADHEGCDHGTEPEVHADHERCDHGAEPEVHADHEGCDHGGEGAVGIELSEEMILKTGIQIHEAQGGTISKASVFPAEIKLNRDTTAAVSPRYASMVRQVFAEIGDEVKKGDILASLENRETMAVYTISAPLDGVIISKDLAIGETAGEDKVLYEVADLSSVWADISVFPQYQHLLHKGMPVTFIAHDGCEATGKVKYISPIVSHETRTFTARCVLEGAKDDFTPGVFVRAKIKVETVEVPVVVEREAIQSLEGFPVLFVPNDHGFQPLEIQLGLADDHYIEIKSGLKPGDRYVGDGAFALKAQMVTSGMDPHAGHGH